MIVLWMLLWVASGIIPNIFILRWFVREFGDCDEEIPLAVLGGMLLGPVNILVAIVFIITRD